MLRNCFFLTEPEAVTGQRWGLFQGRLEECILGSGSTPGARCSESFSIPPTDPPSCRRQLTMAWPLAPAKLGFDRLKASLSWMPPAMKAELPLRANPVAGLRLDGLPDYSAAQART